MRGKWDLPGPGLKPVSPALAGGFLTTVRPGKPLPRHLKNSFPLRIKGFLCFKTVVNFKINMLCYESNLSPILNRYYLANMHW